MHLEKTALFLLFSLTFVSVSAAQQQDPGNQTLSDETVSDVSVPGDTFYGFKRFRERMSLAMARAPLLGSPEKEAKVLSRNAEERLKEARALMGKNDTQRAEKALQRYSEGMGMAMNRAEASTDNRTVEMVAERSRKNQEVLERVSREVSEEAREGIQNAIENSMNLQESLEQDSTKEGSQDNTPDRISRGPGIPDSTDLSSERASGGGAPERSDNGSGDIGSPGISR